MALAQRNTPEKECRLTILAQKSIGKAEFAGPLVRISSTITGKEFISACGLRFLCSVISKSWTEQVKPLEWRRKQIGQSTEKLCVGMSNGNGQNDGQEGENSHFGSDVNG